MAKTYQEMMKFKEQELAEALAWHRAKNPNLTERELGIYAAGFEQGFGKALAAAAFHGVMQVG